MCYWKENISKNSFSRQNLTVFLSILFNNLTCLLLYCTGSLQISPFDKILSPIQVTKLIVPSKVQNQLLPCFQKYMLFSVSKVKTAKVSNRCPPCYTVWLQMAKKRRKCIHLMRFHEFFQTTFGRTIIISVSGHFTCFHIQKLPNRCKHQYNQSNFTFFFWTLFLAGFCHWAQMWATSCWEGKRRQ